MNKFLTTNDNGISEATVKKIIDENCVTYDDDKSVAIQNHDDEVLYTLPKTRAPAPGFVIAVDENNNLFFTNNPLPTGPYLQNPLKSDLTCGGFDILGAGHIRPNTLEVAESCILPIVNGLNGATIFNNTIKVNNISCVSGNTIVFNNIIDAYRIYTQRIDVGVADDRLLIQGPVYTPYNLGCASLNTNSIQANGGSNVVSITSPITSTNDMHANKILVNNIDARSGTTIALISANTTANSFTANTTVSSSTTATNLYANTISTRNTSDIKCNTNFAMKSDKVLIAPTIGNCTEILMTRTDFKLCNISTETTLDIIAEYVNIKSDLMVHGSLLLDNSNISSSSGTVFLNSDLDMTNHIIKNVMFQDCPAIDNLYAAVVDIPTISNDVDNLKIQVSNINTLSNSNSHRINLLDSSVNTLNQSNTYNVGQINTITNDIVVLQSDINENKDSIQGLVSTTETQTKSITDLDNRLISIESNATSINNTVIQKAISPLTINPIRAAYTSLCNLDSSYVSNSNKKIDIVQGACYDIDFGYFININSIGSTSPWTLTNHINFGGSSFTTPFDHVMSVGMSFININYSFVIQSYNSLTKVLAIMYKVNIAYTSTSVGGTENFITAGGISGVNNDVDVNNKVVLDVGVKFFNFSAVIYRYNSIIKRVI